MRKRLFALFLCLVLLFVTPLSVTAATPDGNQSQSASALRYYASGTVTLGNIILHDAAGNELVLDYAYSPRVSISKAIAGQLSALLSNAGFELPPMSFDYQLMNLQKFFVVKCEDGPALATMIESLLNPAAEVASASDVAVVSGTDASVEIGAESKENVSDTDVSATDALAVNDQAEDTSDNSFIIPDAPVVAQTSLNSLMLGSASYDVYPTVEQSVAAAFPEFAFGDASYDTLPDVLGTFSGVTMSVDKLNATVSIQPEPEYVEREVFGETFSVLMVSNVAYRYELQRINIGGACNGAAPPKPPVEEIVSPTDTTTTTEPTVTTTTTAETTAETTAQTTTSAIPLETTASTITTTSTTTTASTESTTATTTTTDPITEGGKRAYVSTRWKRLNLRTGPGTSYKIITQLDKGTEVTVLKQDSDSGWYNVRLANGTTGWCTNEYITLY